MRRSEYRSHSTRKPTFEVAQHFSPYAFYTFRMSGAAPPFVIAIGASGGEEMRGIEDLLASLPQPSPAIVMVVLHRPTDRISALQQILARECTMPVMVASEAEQLVPGNCWTSALGSG